MLFTTSLCGLLFPFVHKHNNTIDSATAQTAKAVKHKYGEYNNVLLTDEELEKLKGEFPDCAERIERLSDYIASKGTAYKSHYATIRNWAKKEKSQMSDKTAAERPLFPDYSDTERYKNIKL